MIEHRLYGFERFTDQVESKIMYCTPEHATMLALQGWTVFDFTESLDMDSEYYDTEQQQVIS